MNGTIHEAIAENTPFFLEHLQRMAIPEEVNQKEVTRLELLVITMMGNSEGTSVSRLAQNLSVPFSTASGVVDRLAKKGLVERNRWTGEDRRVISLHLTDAGRALNDGYQRHLREMVQRFSRFLTEEEFQMAWILMRKILKGLRQDLESED